MSLLDIRDILEHLPHRYPFLLVDRVLELEKGKRIIISTVQKFPYILDELGSEHRGRRFAIIIDR